MPTLNLQLEREREYKVSDFGVTRLMVYHRLANFHDKRNNRHRHLPVFKHNSMYYLADVKTRMAENGAIEVMFEVIQSGASPEDCARPHEGVRELVDLL